MLRLPFKLVASALAAVVVGGCGAGGGSSSLPATSNAAASPNGILSPTSGTVHTLSQDAGTRQRKHAKKIPLGAQVSALQGEASYRLVADESRRKHRKLGALSVGRSAGPVTFGESGRSAEGFRPGAARALVLYDTAGTWGFLGELYAMEVGNLAGHFGSVTAEPVSSYTRGQLRSFTAAIYIGSTYYDSSNDAIPAAFYADVAAPGAKPVIWMGNNIWNFADTVGPPSFETTYGWDPTNSYYAPGGSVGAITSVSYKTATLTRSVPSANDGGVLHPAIVTGAYPAVTTLAQANDTSTGTSFPWAIRSGNLTYIGEIPFSFVHETDRVIALEDLLFDALAPKTVERHRAMVRLEDILANDPGTDPLAAAKVLAARHIPFGFNIVPSYQDPLGIYNNGVPQSITLSQNKPLVKAIKTMISLGGTLVDEGFTHQYQGARNPYDGVSGDDAEFFLAHVDGNNNVIWDGPVPEDSSAWASGRVASAQSEFAKAGIAAPKFWVTPHYFATDTDYRAVATAIPTRYERSLYFSGVLSGGAIDHANYVGQFFPYPVRDAYGTTVVPENLGDYEPVVSNNNPPRLAADLVNEAQLNLVVRDGYASFFYDPSYGTATLGQIVDGITGLGYTFVAAGN